MTLASLSLIANRQMSIQSQSQQCTFSTSWVIHQLEPGDCLTVSLSDLLTHKLFLFQSEHYNDGLELKKLRAQRSQFVSCAVQQIQTVKPSNPQRQQLKLVTREKKVASRARTTENTHDSDMLIHTRPIAVTCSTCPSDESERVLATFKSRS